MRLRFVTGRDLRQTFLFPISSVLTSLLIGFEKSNKVGSASGFKINFFICTQWKRQIRDLLQTVHW